MKTLLVALATSAAGGLAWYGLTPEAKPEPPPQARAAIDPAKLFPETKPVELPPPFFAVNQGPPPPFDPTRSIFVHVPPGYDEISAGDYELFAEGDGYWHRPGVRYGLALHASQLLLPGGVVNKQLRVISDAPGVADYSDGTGRVYRQPVAFASSGAWAADGSFRPYGSSPLVRFPNATGPWVVYQP